MSANRTTASREAFGSNRRRISPGVGCWQVFGLRERVPVTPGFLGPTASQPGGQCSSWGSFSLTAAGQPRIFTEFPLSRGRGPDTSTGRNLT